MRVVATAGHVDHGKSSLVLALTGTDPDRWPEEKTRGLTIDLGFAFTTLPSGQELGFVDVPGHVRFLKNMLAGVGTVEAAILVVAVAGGPGSATSRATTTSWRRPAPAGGWPSTWPASTIPTWPGAQPSCCPTSGPSPPCSTPLSPPCPTSTSARASTRPTSAPASTT